MNIPEYETRVRGREWEDAPADKITNFCRFVTGGGWTEEQRKQHLELMNKIHNGWVYKSHSGFELRLKREVEE